MSIINKDVPNLLESVVSNTIFKTDDYEIKKWEFGNVTSRINGWNDCFCFIIVNNGTYAFNISQSKYQTYTGHVIVEKPHFEYSLIPTIGRCTIFNFSASFYEKITQDLTLMKSNYFANPNIISQLMLSNSVIDYLHHRILASASDADRLEIDDLVFELLYEILKGIGEFETQDTYTYQANHISAVERAKEYIHQYFQEEISLADIAQNCYVSPNHFSRIFKKFTLQSPYQYLLNTRLKHSEVLLRNSDLSIGQVALSCGFSNPNYFATAFKKHYKLIPSDYKQGTFI
jgi:AraC-like DNA-binding protein